MPHPETRLDQSEERFRLLVESVKDYGIFMLTPDGRIGSWNAGAERLKGYRADEILGQHFSIFYPASDVAAGKCERELQGADRDGRFEDEGWRLRKDGTRFWANVVITALRDPSGALVGFAKVTRDLTERKESEERLRELAAEKAMLAEQARLHEFQERFIAILGHDLRNPLAAIDMGASLLRRQLPAESASLRVVDKVHSSAQRMSRMIEQILDLTRSRLAGGLDIVPELADLDELLVAVVEELRTAYPTRTIVLHSAPLPGAWDTDRLAQVFSNLVSNALHYGKPTLPVTVTARLAADVVTVDVHNDGTPIPPNVQATLFSPFRRGTRDSRTATTAGLGLGLYISREIAVGHGGNVTVESSAASGTTFTVTLPRLALPREEARS